MLQLTTQKELVEFLTSYKSAKTATFVSKTVLKTNKKDVATKTTPNPYDKIYKVSVFNGEINFDYEDKVNDARLLEGKKQIFEAGEAVNGLEFISKALSFKDGGYYIKIIPEKSLLPSVYELETGEKVDYELIKPFVPVVKNNGSNQELDKPVVFRSFKLDSIIHVKIPGIMEYTQE